MGSVTDCSVYARRVYLIFLLISSCHCTEYKTHFNLSNLDFPENFIIGAASASYQIEGAWNVNGKSENIWDRLTHSNPDAISNRDNGDIACNSYYKFDEDIKIIKEIGLQMYRFSLSWTRLFPMANISHLNPDGLKYYNAIVDRLLENGIQPMVSIYHWDLPQVLEDRDGWLNPDIVESYAEYARECFRLFGDRVKWWVTLNEPYMVTRGYGKEEYAPMLNLHGTADYTSAHNLLKAHAKAYRIYVNEFKSEQGGKLGIAFFGNYFMPKNVSSADDVAAAERMLQFTIGWFGNPIFTNDGNYPKVMIDYVGKHSLEEGRAESRLPTFTKTEIEELKGSCDFFGLNHYSTKLATTGIQGELPSVDRDTEVIYSPDPSWPQSLCPTMQVVPEGISGVLRWIKEKYNNPLVIITENGYCDDGILEDKRRVSFYTECMRQVLNAIDDGCNVQGYIAWSLLDSFEWKSGYSRKFGLVQVDFNDPQRPRKIKLSGEFFKALMQRHYHRQESNRSNSGSQKKYPYVILSIMFTLVFAISQEPVL